MNDRDRIGYVHSLASQQVPPPYFMPNVTVHGFVWDVRLDEVQAHCDRTFNLGSAQARGFTYRPFPLWPYALMLCIDYPVMISCEPESRRGERYRGPPLEMPPRLVPGFWDRRRRGPPLEYGSRGFVSQREVFIAIPIVRYGESGLGRLTNTALEWTLPFIVVQNPMSAICGREMLGLEKLLADVDFGRAESPQSFRADVALRGWAEQNRSLPVLTVKTGQRLPSPRGAPQRTSTYSLFQTRGARTSLEWISTAADFVESISEGLAPTTMRTVALKQIRDADCPQRALYQAIVGCRTNYSNVDRLRFFHEGDVEITFHSHRTPKTTKAAAEPRQGLRQLLQLVSPSPLPEQEEAPVPIRPRAAFTFNADIDFDDMRTLHTFDTRKRSGDPVTEKVGDLAAPWARPWRGLFSRESKP